MNRIVLENKQNFKITKNYLLNENHVMNPFGGGVFDLQELNFDDLQKLYKKYREIPKTSQNKDLINDALTKIKERIVQVVKGFNLATNSF